MASSRRSRRVVLLAAPIASLASLLACNDIIGLSDFSKGECPGARCAGDGSVDQLVPPDAPVDGGTDALTDAQGSPPTVWPKWPMPNYGEGGLGEPPNALNYGPAGAGEVEDLTTKLVWKTTPLAAVNGAQANAKCASELGSEWRAPKRIELVTLLDYARPSGALIDPRFTGVGPGTLMTSSEVREVKDDKSVRLTGAYWAVSFETGKVVQLTTPASVLCVKGR
ncbi:MAG: DUF1566 domain-containing protein [Deltaproteobacteria bacterium]|nr:DUF1566 domain-containing protein [Deltaproteobacteria bacterium]